MTNAPLPPLGRSLSPWPWLARAVGAASDPRTLILAAIGVFLAAQGTYAIQAIFPGDSPRPETAGLASIFFEFEDPQIIGVQIHALVSTILAPALALIGPIIGMFTADIPALTRLEHAVIALWTLTVWSLFGCSIARVVVARLADGERVGVFAALKFSVKRLGTLLSAPLAVIAVTVGISLLGAVVGLLNRVAPSVAAVLAFIPLTIGLINAVILLGLLAAWPLMVATVAAEGEDFFDVISRSYSYARQRAFPYFSYLLTSAIFGIIGLVLVTVFVKTTLTLADWSISLGAPRDVGFRFGDELGTDKAATIGAFWSGIVLNLMRGWTWSYLFASTSIIYLILRRDIDGTEIHEIYSPKGEDSQTFPFKRGDRGG